MKTAERNCTSDIADCEDGKLPNMDICGCPSCKPKMDIGTGNGKHGMCTRTTM